MLDERHMKPNDWPATPLLQDEKNLPLWKQPKENQANFLKPVQLGAPQGPQGRPKPGEPKMAVAIRSRAAKRRDRWARWLAYLREGFLLALLGTLFSACGMSPGPDREFPDGAGADSGGGSTSDAAALFPDGVGSDATVDGDAGGETDVLDETDLSAAPDRFLDAGEVSDSTANEVSDQDMNPPSWSSFDSLGFGVVASSGGNSGRRLVGGFSPIAGHSTSGNWSIT